MQIVTMQDLSSFVASECISGVKIEMVKGRFFLVSLSGAGQAEEGKRGKPAAITADGHATSLDGAVQAACDAWIAAHGSRAERDGRVTRARVATARPALTLAPTGGGATIDDGEATAVKESGAEIRISQPATRVIS